MRFTMINNQSVVDLNRKTIFEKTYSNKFIRRMNMTKKTNSPRSNKQPLRGLLVIVLVSVCMMFGTAMAKNNNASASNSIVGFWHFELHYSDGSLWYQSIAQYHADGLEMEDAATPPVKPAHVCMGVWKQSGDTVKIYHIIYMYNGNDTLPPANYAVLRETNILNSDGDSVTGTFDVKVHDIKTGNMVQEVKGTTKAKRIDFDRPFRLFSN
jgi:hypothetical protein